jgi:hypothetical protein
VAKKLNNNRKVINGQLHTVLLFIVATMATVAFNNTSILAAKRRGRMNVLMKSISIDFPKISKIYDAYQTLRKPVVLRPPPFCPFRPPNSPALIWA